MSYKDKRKLVKILSPLFSAIFFIGFCLIAYLSYDNGEFDFSNVWKYGTIFVIGFLVLLFIFGPILYKRHINKIKSNYEMKRFKYIDTFYYKKYDIKLEKTEFYFYHIIQDIDSKKYYGISKDCTNSQVEVDFDGKVTVFRGQGFRNKWQRVNFNDEGSFWIKEELNDFYKREGSDIILNYDVKLIGLTEEEPKNNVPVLYNANKDNDIKLLDDVIFIDGLAEFDMK